MGVWGEQVRWYQSQTGEDGSVPLSPDADLEERLHDLERERSITRGRPSLRSTRRRTARPREGGSRARVRG